MKNSDFIVFCDVETSGISYQNDPSYNSDMRQRFQIVSIGAMITDRNFRPLDKFYKEVQYDNFYEWSINAQKIHGLSIPYLRENGEKEIEVARSFEHFLLKNGIDTSYAVHFAGHNFRGFDFYFIDYMMRRYSIPLKFAGRCYDSNGLLLVTGTNDSKDLFEKLGIKRDEGKHNALEDCEATAEAFRRLAKSYEKVQIL